MSVLLRSSIRPKRRVKRREARASIREVCLLAADGSKWMQGDRVSRSGRMYRVETTQAPWAGEPGTPGYVHLSCVTEG